MEIAKIKVSDVRAQVVQQLPVPAGLVNGTITIEYDDPTWDNLKKTVVFWGHGTKDVVDAGNIVTIPHEVIAHPGHRLRIGVYGMDLEENLIIPTLWADLGTVRIATEPSGDLSTDPTLPVWAHALKLIGELAQLNTDAKENLVAAINELLSEMGDIEKLTTDDKDNLVDAANELLRKIGDISALTTKAKTSLVLAVNELLALMGDVNTLNTDAKGTLVAAINELLVLMGSVKSLNTKAKGTLVAAINELLALMGDANTLNTTAKGTFVAAINELLALMGNVNSLNTTAKGTLVAAINELLSQMGKLENLNTTDKSNLVAAANELLSNIGDISKLDTATKESLVLAVNELLRNIGDISKLNTTAKTSLVLAVNELLGNIGDVSKLDTTAKENLVSAVNELLRNIGDISQLDTQTKENLVSAVNELLANMGDISKLDTTAKENLVSAVNELLRNIGDISQLSTDAKESLVLAVNELLALIGNVDNLNTTAKGTLVAAINELLALMGDANTLNTTAKGTLVAAINELLATMGSTSTLNTTAKGTLVASINEVLAQIAKDIAAHNTTTEAHADLRLELEALTERINAILDSDDQTLDELSEIVAYIKSNKTLIDAITTSKVNVTDIVDNLVTNVSDKPLSAAQGVAIKALIDALQTEVDTAQTNLTNHNTDTAAHADLRAELQVLTNRINAVLDSDDTTLDELSEIVDYIKSNKSLIDAITTSKVNVTDIVNDLVTNVTNRPLSAAQGVVLKGLIDTLTTTVSGKAPTSHASNATTYGAGSSSNYGHVKLSDATNGTSDTNGGVAATPAAVKAAYDLANSKAAASHGNHVPATETASNVRFLRNDNTWQDVTPENIGAATPAYVDTAITNALGVIENGTY